MSSQKHQVFKQSVAKRKEVICLQFDCKEEESDRQADVCHKAQEDDKNSHHADEDDACVGIDYSLLKIGLSKQLYATRRKPKEPRLGRANPHLKKPHNLAKAVSKLERIY